jgi:hypothetical protein
MRIRELPLRNDVDSFTYRINLDARTYNIAINWNTRDERWYIYIYDAENRALATSPLLVEADLWRRFRLSALPRGLMFLTDPAGDTRECARNELGTRCKLVYVEESAQ